MKEIKEEDVITKEDEVEVKEEIEEKDKEEKENNDFISYEFKTKLGKKVESGEITNIDQILSKGLRIYEPAIVDKLIPNLEVDLLLIGQAKKSKFGGGKRRAFRQTQKVTREGRKPKFSTIAIVGNRNGYIGVGYGKAKETVPAREKAIRNAKLNIFKIKRGCGSWECGCGEPHSIPFEVEGKCGSVKVVLKPAPKGVGLCVHEELKKILNLAGITDVWSKAYGQTGTRINLVYACIDALKKLSKYKVNKDFEKLAGLVDGEIK